MTIINYKEPSHKVDMRYIKANCSEIKDKPRGFWRVENDLHVFKKGWSDDAFGDQCIINMVIPKGSEIYAERVNAKDYEYGIDCRKMRASKALVHSIVKYEDCEIGLMQNGKSCMEFSEVKPISKCSSTWDQNFIYRKGKIAVPVQGFFYIQEQCTSGIHFFLNLVDATMY